MTDLIVFAVVGAVAVGFFFLIRLLAAKAGGANLDRARTAFAALEGFTPSSILIYLGSAIAFDPSSSAVAIWEKKAGARRVAPDEVSSWHCGEQVTTIMGESTSAHIVQLFTAKADAPFFKVGVLRKADIAPWRAQLSAAFGAEKQQGYADRTIGPDVELDL